MMPRTEIDELEAIADRGERLSRYQVYTARHPQQYQAWHNYAVHLLEADRAMEARTAALRAIAHEPGEREHFRRLAADRGAPSLVDVGDYELQHELVATRAHQVYRAVRRGEDRAVLIRRLGDRTRDDAARLFAEHEAASARGVPNVVRALGTVTAEDGALYQLLDNIDGDALSTLFDSQRGALAATPAALLVASVAQALVTARDAGMQTFDLRPESLLRDRAGHVRILGPLARPPEGPWTAPEERDGRDGGEAADVLRLGLLLYTSSGAALPPRDVRGVWQFDLPSAWLQHEGLLAVVRRATAPVAGARHDLDSFVRALTRVATRSAAVGVGTRLGGFELRRQLAKNAVAEVWLGEDQEGTPYAVKVLAGGADSGDARLRFEQEAKIGRDVDHPGVVKVLAAPEMIERPLYFVMELVDGGSLEERLNQGPLTVDETVDLGVQIADAMEAVHQVGVVHRDLSPNNILFARTDGNGTVKVADFSHARVSTPAPSGQALTEVRAIIGTRGYTAPEQLKDVVLDGRADIWSLGAILYRCLAGGPPDALGVLPGASAFPEDAQVPRPLALVITKMLAQDRDARFSGMRAVADALRAWRADTTAALARLREQRTIKLTVAALDGRSDDCAQSWDARVRRPELPAYLRSALARALSPALALLAAHPAGPSTSLAVVLSMNAGALRDCAAVRLQTRGAGEVEPVVLRETLHEDPALVAAVGNSSAAVDLFRRLTIEIGLETLLVTMTRCAGRADIAAGSRGGGVNEGDVHAGRILAALRRLQYQLHRPRSDRAAEWSGGYYIPDFKNSTPELGATARDLERQLRDMEHSSRRACAEIVTAINAVPRAAETLGPTASTIETRVRELVDRYRRNHGALLAAWLGRCALARLLIELAGDDLTARTGVGTSRPTGHDLVDGLREATEILTPARQRLEEDRSQSAAFVALLRGRATAFQMWWPFLFKDEAYEDGVRHDLQRVAKELERETESVVELVSANLQLGGDALVLPVRVVARFTAGRLERVELIDVPVWSR